MYVSTISVTTTAESPNNRHIGISLCRDFVFFSVVKQLLGALKMYSAHVLN